MEHVLLEWLEGRSVPGGARMLKAAGIYDRVRPMNARALFSSFTHWLQTRDHSGALVVLDLRPCEAKRLTARQRAERRDSEMREAIRTGLPVEEIERILDAGPAEPFVFFGDKAFLQMLDLLRHFIDDVESFPGLALIVLTSDGFYDERSPKNFYMYNALQTRIAQEVRDSAHPNLVAMLTHLGSSK